MRQSIWFILDKVKKAYIAVRAMPFLITRDSMSVKRAWILLWQFKPYRFFQYYYDQAMAFESGGNISGDAADMITKQAEHPSFFGQSFTFQPVISVVMAVRNTDSIDDVIATVRSIRKQVYWHWQLIVMGEAALVGLPELQTLNKREPRITFVARSLPQAAQFDFNESLALATGEHVCWLQPGQILTPNALYTIAYCLQRNPRPVVVFSDERTADNQYFFKPDAAADLLLTRNLLGGFVVIEKTKIEKIGGFRQELEDAQHFDLLVRLSEKTKDFFHVPLTLCSFVSRNQSIDPAVASTPTHLRAINDALQRRAIAAQVTYDQFSQAYRLQEKINGNPLISIIIPFRDQPRLLKSCVTSIVKLSSYSNIEIIGINNGSVLPKTARVATELEKK